VEDMMNSFPPFIYKKEKKVIPQQIQLELDIPEYIEQDKSSSKDEETTNIIIIEIL